MSKDAVEKMLEYYIWISIDLSSSPSASLWKGL